MRRLMPATAFPRLKACFKSDFIRQLLCLAGLVILLPLQGCTTNPATGETQFTALMSPGQEARIGAKQHPRILKAFGGSFDDQELEDYVNEIGQKLVPHTERQDVKYQFFVLDTPEVNAFAVPGGYIYVSRGLLALANSEAELAAVLAHEIGHITARHSAERVSHGLLTSLGAAVVSSAVEGQGVSQLASLGADLYIKSYSRKQEHQADELGIRYLQRAGYDTKAMGRFLRQLDAHSTLQEKITGRAQEPPLSYFSTHPLTRDRVERSFDMATNYAENDNIIQREPYLNALDGLIYGDSARQGFVRGQRFIHPKLGFTFTAPPGFSIINKPQEVVMAGPSGALAIFDAAGNPGGISPMRYLQDVWLKGEATQNPQYITIDDKAAATAQFRGRVNNQAMAIRLIAVEWNPDLFYRFQIAIPVGASAELVTQLKEMTYSLRPLNEQEKQELEPYQLDIARASQAQTVQDFAAQMPHDRYKLDRFRVLNGLWPDGGVEEGALYKLVTE